MVAKNGNNVEATFDFVERIVRLVAFDNVASTLLLVWTELAQKARGAKQPVVMVGLSARITVGTDNPPPLRTPMKYTASKSRRFRRLGVVPTAFS